MFQLLADFEGSILGNPKIRCLPELRIESPTDYGFSILDSGSHLTFGFLKIGQKRKQTGPRKLLLCLLYILLNFFQTPQSNNLIKRTDMLFFSIEHVEGLHTIILKKGRDPITHTVSFFPVQLCEPSLKQNDLGRSLILFSPV